MTEEEFNKINWQHGNRVQLTNGKEYYVMVKKKRHLLLLSVEYMKCFVAHYGIIDHRTSDYVGHTNPKNMTTDTEMELSKT